jgi:hypothetical protein
MYSNVECKVIRLLQYEYAVRYIAKLITCYCTGPYNFPVGEREKKGLRVFPRIILHDLTCAVCVVAVSVVGVGAVGTVGVGALSPVF